MSRMGDAIQWIQENDLEDDPKALTKYIEYQNKIKKSNSEKNGNSENTDAGKWKETGNIPNRRM